jgi:hypothetical protein
VTDKLAEIEAALAANPTPELLAGYGDALHALGDPRGELIAIDLRVAAHGPSAELAARKRELIDGWLGAELAARVLEIGAVDCGFVDIPWGLKAVEVERMLSHEGLHGALRTFALEDSDAGLCRGLDLVCAARPPWLEHVQVVRYEDGFDPALRDQIAIDDDRARTLVARFPRLRALTLAGPNVFDELVHDGVRAICLYDHDSVGSLLRAGRPWASLVELDLQLFEPPGPEMLAAMLPPARVPALRRLDLARNEARHREEAFALVATNPIVRQLAWLRVPSVRTDADLDAAERALAALPADGDLIVSRAYADRQPTRAPSPRLRIPPPRPWPPTDDVNPGRLSAIIPGQETSADLDLREAIALMETRFDTLGNPERDTWLELWSGLRALATTPTFELSARALAAAVAALEPGSGQLTLTGLRTALAGCTGDTVQLRRWSLF